MDQFTHVDFPQGDIDRAGIGAGHLQQVTDHALEAPQILPQQLQRALGPGRQRIVVRLEHFERSRQRRQRRAQLVTDVGVEASLSLDAHLELIDHGVERGGQPHQVGIGRVGFEPRVELATGDGYCHPGDTPQRTERTITGEPAQARPRATS